MEEDIGREVRRDIVRTGKGVARTIVYEFLVELLGALIPGVIFTAIMGFFLISLSSLFVNAYTPPAAGSPAETKPSAPPSENGSLIDTKKIAPPASVDKENTDSSLPGWRDRLADLMKPSLQMTLLFLVVSYVVGHFFFRHPPKKPDGESARHIWRKHLREGKVHPCPENSFLKKTYKPAKYEKYPFPLKLTCSRLMHNSPSAFWSTCPLMPVRPAGVEEVPMGLWRICRAIAEACHVLGALWRGCGIILRLLLRGRFALAWSEAREASKAMGHWVRGAMVRCAERALRCFWWPFCVVRKCPVDGKVEFPYLYLHEYLEQRDLNHLAELVPWEGEKERTHKNRSKLFLNFLKVRLQSVLPDWYQVLARNEAHVRLMSSTWYMARALRFCGFILGVSLGSFSLSVPKFEILWPAPSSMDHLVFGAQSLAAGGVALFVAMWLVKWTIEHFLFYQRIREVTQVLETAYYAHIMDPNLRLFEGLDIDAPLRKDF